MQPSVWERQKAAGVDIPLPKPFQEIMAKTVHPFISAVRDTAPRGAVFLNRRLFLVGDAHALFRPHIGASTNQSALHALELEKVFRGEISIEQWEAKATAYAKWTRAFSVAVGDFFQKGYLAALPWAFSFIVLLLKEIIAAKLRAVFGRSSTKKKHVD